MEKTRCPRCGQDYVIAAVIKPLGFEIMICPECEAFWGKNTPIAKETFFNYCSFTVDHGLPCTWDILELQERAD